MKKYPVITISSLLLSAAGLHAQATEEAFTTPVGYVTHTLKAGQFNFIGLTVHGAIEVSGDFEAVSGTTLTDTDADFNSSLTDGDTYILEVTSGALTGTIQEILWASNGVTTLVTPDNLGTEGLVASDTYQIRRAATVSTVFGETNSSGLLPGNSTNSDVVWLSTGAGAFAQYYYSDGTGFGVSEGWRRIGTGDADQADATIPYVDAMFVQRRGLTDQDLVVSGSVKLESTTVAVTDQYNYIGGVYPVGTTLESSSLESVILKGNSTSADVIWVPIGSGAFAQYYYSDGSGFGVTEGWRRVGTGDVDVKDDALESGVIIQRRSADPYNATIEPPFDYSNL